MQRCLARHKTSGEVFILAVDERDYIQGSLVLHWSEWQQADSGAGPDGAPALRDDIELFDAELDDDFTPYHDGGEWAYIACQDAPSQPLNDLR